jgi:hypothetical protein
VVAFLYAGLVVQLFLVYRTFANTRVPARAAGIATIAVTVLWELARRAAAAYFADYALYGTLYGSFAAAVAVLVWIYASAVIFVWGAFLTAALAGVESTGRPAATPAAAPASGRAALRLGIAAGLTGLAAAAAATVVVQNVSPVTVRLLWWHVGAVPGGALVSAAFIGGSIVGGLVTGLWLRRPSPQGPPAPPTDRS